MESNREYFENSHVLKICQGQMSNDLSKFFHYDEVHKHIKKFESTTNKKINKNPNHYSDKKKKNKITCAGILKPQISVSSVVHFGIVITAG